MQVIMPICKAFIKTATAEMRRERTNAGGDDDESFEEDGAPDPAGFQAASSFIQGFRQDPEDPPFRRRRRGKQSVSEDEYVHRGLLPFRFCMCCCALSRARVLLVKTLR